MLNAIKKSQVNAWDFFGLSVVIVIYPKFIIK